jgi:membrane associated rhomboid family serine protease
MGGLVAMLAPVLADPYSTVPNLGASGAIAAVMGAFIVTYSRDQISHALFHIRVRANSVRPGGPLNRLLVSNPALPRRLCVAPVQTGGVAYLAHIGGFIFGVATARLFEDGVN